MNTTRNIWAALALVGACAATATGGIDIRCDYPGGNVKVVGIDEQNGVLNVAPDLRDTAGKWFHWDFTVRGAAGRSLHFRFPQDRFQYLSSLGPAISRDGGATWTWLHPDGTRHEPANAFDYTFAPDEAETRFAVSIPYTQKDWDAFMAKCRGRGVECGVLCKSQSGTRDTELARIPCRACAKWLFVFTARHHACEASANPPMEGVVEEILSGTPEGEWVRANADCMFVPFMDKDGVENGDQGKNRRPHDHNRDYLKGRYTSVRAVKELLVRESVGKQIVFVDLHSPHVRSLPTCPEQDQVFSFGSSDARQNAHWNTFREKWKETQKGGALVYNGKYDIPAGKGHDLVLQKARLKGLMGSRAWVGTLPNCYLSTCCEFGYSLCGGVYSPSAARELGRNMLKALVRTAQADGPASAQAPRAVMNVVNFVRALDPRQPRAWYAEALREEVALNRKYKLKNTILFQYDALIDPELRAEAAKSDPALTEFGLWFEMSRPLNEAAGLPWRPKHDPSWNWDWFINPGFLMAYTHAERKALIDAAFARFKADFGYYPKSVGSWLLDAWSMDYMVKTYGVDGFCICREQDNTDAYGLRGGYSNGAYYPSRRNMLSAAVDMSNAVQAPVFKMLTPDPIYNYANPKKRFPDYPFKSGCPTLEPVWAGGNVKSIVDWYFRVYTSAPGLLNLSYMQTGQENSFGWAKIKQGLPYQCERIAALRDAGVLTVETMGETARRFKADHPQNCPQTQVALEDWSGADRNSIWYNSSFYRANLFRDGNRLYFRDIHKMSDAFEEPFLDKVCTGWQANYFTPPVVDEFLFRTNGVSGVMSFDGDFKRLEIAAGAGDTLAVVATRADGSTAKVVFDERGIRVEGATLAADYAPAFRQTANLRGDKLSFTFQGFRYEMGCRADVAPTPSGFTFRPRSGNLYLDLSLPDPAHAADSRVEFRECPKCDKRIRIDLAAGKAYVNLCRLEGASRDEVAARAAQLLDAAKIPPARDPKLRPLMGWSSWNTFGVDISETIILETARAMAANGLKEAGYTYVNIDDGFFWGHGEDGILRFHPQRFPNGMKPTVDGIHALGLKAGIYSDAGADTCGSMWGGSGSGGKDKGGVGAGLYGHDAADCKLHFNDLGFDFIKVDYCGGGKLKLNEKDRYTEIANAIKATGRTDVRLNLCRWAFPGTWAADIAESWRTTKDIRANWKSVKDLIGENLYLSAYARPGHYNDMDMLEVGQLKGAVKSIFGKHGDTGLTTDEETTHFGMWCMLSSPLLIGCDVRTIPVSTKALITNPYLLAMNQNDLGLQGYVVARDGDAYILVKDACEKFGRSRYVALYNGSDAEHEFTVRAAALDLGGAVDAFDLVEMADVGRFTDHVSVKVAPHATKFYRFNAETRLQRTVYEAETAFLTDYQELWDATKAGTAFPDQMKEASGGVYVRYIGNRASNDLVWKDVKVDAAGEYVLAFDYAAPEDRAFDLSIDGGAATRVATPGTGGKIGTVKVTVPLAAGVHTIRLSNATAWMPDLDRLTIVSR